MTGGFQGVGNKNAATVAAQLSGLIQRSENFIAAVPPLFFATSRCAAAAFHTNARAHSFG